MPRPCQPREARPQVSWGCRAAQAGRASALIAAVLFPANLGACGREPAERSPAPDPGAPPSLPAVPAARGPLAPPAGPGIATATAAEQAGDAVDLDRLLARYRTEQSLPAPEVIDLGSSTAARRRLGERQEPLIEHYAREGASFEVCYALGELYTTVEELGRGMGFALAALDLAPDDDSRARSLVVLGANRANGLAFSEASALFERACRLAPGYGPAWRYAGDTWFARGEFDRARACYERAVALQVTYTEAQLGLGRVLEEAGEYERAEQALRTVVARDEFHPEACYRLARIARARGDEQAAARWDVAHADATILDDLGVRESGQTRAQLLVTLGIKLLERGESERALARFEAATVSSERDTRAMALVGATDALLRLGRSEDAARRLLEVEEFAPDHPLLGRLREQAAAAGTQSH